MEQAQSYSIKIDSETNEILSMGLSDRMVEEVGAIIYKIRWELLEPFFNQSRHHRKYTPIVADGVVKKFKIKEEFELEIVFNTDDPVLKSLRSYENFIANCKIQVDQQLDRVVLSYNADLFDLFTNEDNLEKLQSIRDRIYNIYITRQGDPFTIFDSYSITLNNIIDGKVLEIPFIGEEEISVYVIA